MLGPGGKDADPAASLREWRSSHGATHAAGLTLTPAPGGFRSEYILLAGAEETRKARTHLVPHPMASRWAANTALTALWNLLRNRRPD
jgi:hypothetical protein